ncbi:MAG TPA: ATP-binding cassette domain-containing protein [Azospirillaceae bacterium]|nr:ATP-binding cassette domain-containing protein [Azospirillaceae bacterium]
MRAPGTIASLTVVLLVGVACLAGPWALPHDGGTVFWDHMLAPPNTDAGLWFGTDANGHDLLVRTLEGGRVSLTVGLAATLVSVVIGAGWGMASGFLGGRGDALMMRIVDVLYGLPFPFLAILLTVFFGRHLLLVLLAIGAVEWLDMARIVRGQTLSLKTQPYIDAARCCGLGRGAILRRHILPNLAGPVTAYATLTVPRAILLESYLSFLGLGPAEPATSWGHLINEGAGVLEAAPWVLAFPAGFLTITLLCLTALGEGMRPAVPPPQKPEHHPVPTPVPEPAPLLAVTNLSVRLGARTVAHAVGFTIDHGETVALVGPSGAGKSQTAQALLGLGGHIGGSVRFRGQELLGLPADRLNRIRGARIGFVPQNTTAALNPYRSIGAPMIEMLRHHRGLDAAQARVQAIAMLERVRLPEAARRFDHPPHELSGGMRQRVAIAMALSCQPDLVIVDEPTTGLDASTQTAILDLLRDLKNRHGTAFLLISHDLEVVAGLADRVMVMQSGRLVEASPTRDLFQAPRHLCTRRLLAAAGHELPP